MFSMLSPRRMFAIAGVLCTLLLAAALVTAGAASNTVPVSGASDTRTAFGLANLNLGTRCAGIALADIVVGSNAKAGGNALVLGSSASGEHLTGGGGNDCIFGGGGTDTIDGGGGNADICWGNATSTFRACNTRYPPR